MTLFINKYGATKIKNNKFLKKYIFFNYPEKGIYYNHFLFPLQGGNRENRQEIPSTLCGGTNLLPARGTTGLGVGEEVMMVGDSTFSFLTTVNNHPLRQQLCVNSPQFQFATGARATPEERNTTSCYQEQLG